ncbi:MAG: hypothetical protein KGL59_13180 [Acidobacteriota bacterium]|nr:hypothetical protein [Acidobacteriota bacterium]
MGSGVVLETAVAVSGCMIVKDNVLDLLESATLSASMVIPAGLGVVEGAV